MRPEIELAGVTVSERDGLYLMRDVHRASGEPSTKSPSVFLLNKATQDLIEEMGESVVRERGKNGGVWASEELVCAYAMWISPKFYIKVVRTFLMVAKGDMQGAALMADTSASRRAAIQLATMGIKADRSMLNWREKAVEYLEQAEKISSKDSYWSRVKSKVHFLILEELDGPKARKTGKTKYEIVQYLARNNQMVLGFFLDQDSYLQILDDMEESGDIKYIGSRVFAA